VQTAITRALLLHRGFTPEEIDDLPKRTVERYLTALPVLIDLHQHHHG